MTATEGLVEQPRPLVEALRAAADGDLRAREELSGHCLPQLTAFARARGAIDPGGVADTVMVEFLGRLDRLEFESSGQMWAYLYRIARSRVIDERRASKPIELREQSTIEGLLPPSFGMEDQVAERHYVDDLLASLTSEQREVLQMRFLDDLSIEETATRTGRTLTAVKGLQRRAIRAITAAALLVLVLVGGLVLALTNDDNGIPTLSEGPPPTSGFSSDRAVIEVPEQVDTDGAA
ncbi:MAG: sigma-70 family RNA polymerase sigma factor, partial [Actinomycetota bacterium]